MLFTSNHNRNNLAFVLLFWHALFLSARPSEVLQKDTTGKSDRYFNTELKRIAFGSCNKHDRDQPLWKKIMGLNPDVWIWLGDAVYGDTKILSYIWIPSSLPDMKEKYDKQKLHPQYKEFLQSGIPIIGTWDDHDYGTDFGGKYFKYRLQSQVLYLDFLDEPIDSPRRHRRGMYSSYSFGKGDRIVKIILLDTRSHKDTGSYCDMLGDNQWKWFEEQLADPEPHIVVIGSGMQILSDIPFIDKWMSCKYSLDRLLWLVQQRSRVFFISGDVHFAEMNCLNVSGTGYPLYEVTSSALTHSCSTSLLPYGVCDWTLNFFLSEKVYISVTKERQFDTDLVFFYDLCQWFLTFIRGDPKVDDGYPVYEFTSSGMTHTCSFPPPKRFCDWSLKNVIASCYRISNVITMNNFGIIDINWDQIPRSLSFSVHGEKEVFSKWNVSIADLQRRRQPAHCPPAIEQPNWYWKRVFWSWVVISVAVGILLILWLVYCLSRWFFKGILTDLQTGMRNGIAHLRIKKKKKDKKTKDN